MKLNKKSIVFPVALAIALLFVQFSLAEPSIQRYFPGFSGIRFVLTDEQTDVSAAQLKGPFPVEFLDDAQLTSLSTWRMTDEHNVTYDLQVWEVLDSLGSYELYSHWPLYSGLQGYERLSAPVGNWFNPEKSVFWRGNYFISAGRNDHSPLQPKEFSTLIDQFSSNIGQLNVLPVTISHLPEEEISGSAPLFYLGAETLKRNELFPEPLLAEIGFNDRIEIAFASYGPEESPLFLIGYPTHELAREYSARIRADLDGYFSKQSVFMKRSGLLVAIFIGPEDLAVKVLNQVSYAPTIQYFQKKGDEPRPSKTDTFLGLITRAILGTGSFIIFIIIAGFFAGVLRYQIMQRFPAFAKRNNSVRLNLD